MLAALHFITPISLRHFLTGQRIQPGLCGVYSRQNECRKVSY